jgi:hypothetical protein
MGPLFKLEKSNRIESNIEYRIFVEEVYSQCSNEVQRKEKVIKETVKGESEL